jgi:hypothetical protein
VTGAQRPGATGQRKVDPERVAVVWISTQRGVIVRWAGEPVVEHLESGVPPRRRAVGSVRRGPARPEGGGRVPGHGTEARHDTELRRFLEAISSRLDGLEEIEVAGRGTLPERFAELLRRLAARRNEDVGVTSRTLSRRPSDAQLKARLRRLADRELPRKLVGRYRLPPQGPTTPTGRPVQPAAGRQTLRPAREPEWRQIADAVEAMLVETDEKAPAAAEEPAAP